ncbi:MAG TPA: helix-turn-helix domain-containing protein, partial [Pseudonocardia sp.]|nr:helix-turn-helix domain-containing protein [Pseudonocardia sp.]
MRPPRRVHRRLPLPRAARPAGDKWSALTLGALEDGPRRFGALRGKLEGISPRMLTQTLRRLEELALVDRVVYPAVPLH